MKQQCEICDQADAVVCCADGIWRCASCADADGYDVLTGAGLTEEDNA